MRKIKRIKKGLSLIEVMIATAILVFALTAILASYINMFILSDLSRDLTFATNAVKAKMEELKGEDFDDLDAFSGVVFDLDNFDLGEAKGRIEVEDLTTYSDLKEVRIVACFRNRQRVIGEDLNLNGLLDIDEGEDVNNNSVLDSPVELICFFTR